MTVHYRVLHREENITDGSDDIYMRAPMMMRSLLSFKCDQIDDLLTEIAI